MSFSIVFGQNQSEPIMFTKTILNTFTYSGYLKENCSISNPHIIVEGNASTFASCNYMEIADFSRKYYIVDMIAREGKMVEIVGRVDVLSSFRDEILTNVAITSRQENEWNLYLNDGSFSVYQNDMVVTKSFGISPLGNYNYILAVAGG